MSPESLWHENGEAYRTLEKQLRDAEQRMAEQASPRAAVEMRPPYWWLSFADERGFLGATVVPGSSFEDALTAASLLGVNPGGDVQGIEILGGSLGPFESGRLYSKEDINKIDKAVPWPDDL